MAVGTTDATPRHARGRGGLVIVLVLVIAAAGFGFYWMRLATYHLVVVEEGKLYRDGNRGLRELANALRRSGARTVISIVDDDEVQAPEFVQEQAYLADHGIDYVRIPIRKGAYPTTEQLREFLAIATDPARQPVLYHDNEGIRRAGMMMAAYQESAMGFDDARAKAAMQGFGHSDRTLDDVRAFIDAYDGQKRELAPIARAGGPSATAPSTTQASP